MMRFLSFTISILFFVSCSAPTSDPIQTIAEPTTSEKLNQLLTDYSEEGLKLYPLEATSMGDNRYNDQMPNFLSDDFVNAEKAYFEKYKKLLIEINASDLSESEKLSKATLTWELEMSLNKFNFNESLTPINQMWTLHLTFGQLASGSGAQPFKTVDDYNNWVKRVDGYLEWLKSAELKMKDGIAANHVLPKSLIVKVIPQLKAMITSDVKSHLFYQPIVNLPESFSDEDKAKLTKVYTDMVANKVVPAYQATYDFMSSEYLEAGRTSSGIDDTPNGKAFYNHQIKKYTTTNMTAQEIRNLGLSEVDRISTEMEKVKTQVGFEGDLKSFFDFVRNNKELMPYSEPQQIIENFNTIHERMKPQIEKLFGLTPKTGFEVRQTEKFREASASAEYNQGSMDGTRPGIFYTPIPDASKYNIFSDEALFLHEAIPGHHLQISLTQESSALPEFRKTLWYSAYGEGWALYCESLGKELGLYTDPYQYFGMLGMEMHRAIRLVVDPGIHALGWTREKAIQYSLDHEAEGEASIISEIERYMANPGQALSYKIGQLKILDLRAKAEKALGDKFDIKQFHNEVLETGCIPLALLEAKIDKWIAESK